jgi:hypothetical protein
MAKKPATTGNVELRPLEGVTRINGIPRKVRQKDFEILMFKGRQIATLPKRPGAPVNLLGGIVLSVAEKKEVADYVASKRDGVAPATVQEPVDLPYEIIDDEAMDE